MNNNPYPVPTSIMDWIQNNVIPWFRMALESSEYAPLLIILLVILIITLIQMRGKKTKTTKAPKKEPAPAGGYKNFKGNTWYPDGRQWNQNTQQYENPDYKETPAENES